MSSSIKASRRPCVHATHPTFELHTLGWEAFQNLCGHVMQEVLGQTVTIFSPTGDAGKDGAFSGRWKRIGKESFSGRFVVQCKFTAVRDRHLLLSDLTDELEKAKRLATAGLASTYLILTNARLTGAKDRSIREAFLALPGIEHCAIFGAEWLTQQILKSKRLRAFVPRIYGLGDLSQILDERVYRQATDILKTWRDNLRKFVPTDAHLRSVRALMDEGFVLLLGEPMAGKSTIAAALALAAADDGCAPIFVTHPSQFTEHWNPDDPKQFFWVDDAFGPTQYQSTLAAEWNRIFPVMAAALCAGTRILFTSRTYIYKQAVTELKVSAFPPLGKSHVVIEVEKLTRLEKERILYNHLRLGRQPVSFRQQIKPHLSAIASNPKFFPEVARRLGNPFFTRGLDIAPEALRKFVDEPADVLSEIIDQLDRSNFGALALLFMRAGRVDIPLEVESQEAAPLELLGVTPADLRHAFRALAGSLVAEGIEAGQQFWRFRHPSVRDAMATNVARQPDLLDIYIAGAKPHDLLSEVVCGGVQFDGAKVRIPENRYDRLINKLRVAILNDWRYRSLVSFFQLRCPIQFVVQWKQKWPNDFATLCEQAISLSAFASVLARLKKAGALEEEFRVAYVRYVSRCAAEEGDVSFLSSGLRILVTDIEVDAILARVKQDLVPVLDDLLSQHENDFDPERDDPTDHFSDWRSNLEAIESLVKDPEIVTAAEDGLESIRQAIERLEEASEEHKKAEKKKAEEKERMEEYRREEAMYEAMRERRRSAGLPAVRPANSNSPPRVPTIQRSIFDDVDDE